MSFKDSSQLLTVGEVAEELGMSSSGVYKLIGRKRLRALRLSERGLRIPRPALDAYQARIQGAGPSTQLPKAVDDPAAARQRFETATGCTPEGWLTAWKADEIDDSAENMRLTIDAASIVASGAPAYAASIGSSRA